MHFHLLNLFHRSSHQTTLRNFIFGVEDSLVSTVGLLAGVATADMARPSLLTTGIVLIVVEGFSMGVGSFLTEETAEEMDNKTPNAFLALRGGLTMFFSYILAGLIPLAPYLFVTGASAIICSIAASLAGLFLLGYLTAYHYHRPNPMFRALRMLILGGLATLVGILIGKLFHL